jgi:hypothetical protein
VTIVPPLAANVPPALPSKPSITAPEAVAPTQPVEALQPARTISYVQPAAFPQTGAGGMPTPAPWLLAVVLALALGGIQRIQRKPEMP